MKNKKWRAGTSRSPFSVKVPVNPEYPEHPEHPDYPEYPENSITNNP